MSQNLRVRDDNREKGVVKKVRSCDVVYRTLLGGAAQVSDIGSGDMMRDAQAETVDANNNPPYRERRGPRIQK
jgi:hypothetical protein